MKVRATKTDARGKASIRSFLLRLFMTTGLDATAIYYNNSISMT
jgi:hypothetical protein